MSLRDVPPELSEMQLLEQLQKLEVQGAKNVPKKKVTIAECGILR